MQGSIILAIIGTEKLIVTSGQTDGISYSWILLGYLPC